MVKEVVLDTDVFSYLHGNRPELLRFEPYLVGHVGLLAFPSVAELYFGARKDGWGPARLERLRADLAVYDILLPTDALLRLCGELRAEAHRTGHPLGHPLHGSDLWIAACAIHYEVPLVTGNGRHYAGLPGLEVRTGVT